MSYPSRRGGSSMTLVVTFVLGLVIGGALLYAVADSLGWDFSARSVRSNLAKDDAPSVEAPVPAPDVPEKAPAPTVEKVAPSPETPPAAPKVEAPPVAVESFSVPAEAIAKHVMVDIQGNSLDDATKAALAAVKPGIVLLRTQNIESAESGAALIAEIKAAVGGEGLDGWPLIAVSQEGGEDNPLLVDDAPTAQRIADEQDFSRASKNARAAGLSYAAAARAMGVAVILAPRLDIYEAGASDTALQARSFGVDAQDVADLGASFQVGVREGGALAVGKYFPGMGQAVKADDGVLEVPHTEIRLLVAGLLPFTQVAESGIAGMMVAQARVPGLETMRPELTAAESTTILQMVLREQLKFNGVVIADDISSCPTTNARPVGEVMAGMLAAGCDVVYLGTLELARAEAAVAGAAEAMTDGRIAQASWLQSDARLETWRTFLAQPPLATPPPAKLEPAPQPEGTEKKSHKVLRNETLVGIAKEYGVSVADLMAWNAIKDENIRYGQKLDVYVPKKAEETPENKPETKSAPEEKAATTEPVTPEMPAAPESKPEVTPEAAPSETPVTEAPPADAPKADETTTTPPAEESPPETDSKPVETEPATAEPAMETQLHEVVSGDTLRKIAGKYQTTEAVLLKLNKLKSPDHVLLGTKMKVPKQP